MKPTITWNADKFGVEIKTDTEHFVISAQPSLSMSWYDATRFFSESKHTEFPTKEQLLLVRKHLDEINAIIKANKGYEIRNWLWASSEHDAHIAEMVGVYTPGTRTALEPKKIHGEVRPVCILTNLKE